MRSDDSGVSTFSRVVTAVLYRTASASVSDAAPLPTGADATLPRSMPYTSPFFGAAFTRGMPFFVVMSAGAAETAQSGKAPLGGWGEGGSRPVRRWAAGTP